MIAFLISCKTLIFIFLPFLNLGAQIRSPQNRFSVLKSPVDQPMVIVVNPFLANFPFLYPENNREPKVF